MQKIAVTGHNGRLGHELVKRGCIPIECDITSSSDIIRELSKINVDVIINCAAYTDVSACENDEEYKLALEINYYGVKRLRTIFQGLLVHLSTDYVFDGKRGPYSENSPPTKAVNNYGLTKQGAEIYLQSMPFPFSIVRTTCLYDNYKLDDFVFTALTHLRIDDVFTATTKLSGNPTYVPHLAEAILMLIKMPQIPEIIHIAGRDVMTRYEFALMIANVFGYDTANIIPTNKNFGAGNRPTKGGLKTKLAEKLGLPIYSTLEGLQQYKKDLENEV